MRATLILIIMLGVLGPALARAGAPVGAGKVFSGPEGEQVAIVPLTSHEGKEVLVYVQGTGGPFDGTVLLHEVLERESRADYRTRYRGEDFITLSLQAGSGDTRRRQLHVPGRQLDVPLSYDEARTQALKAEQVYALYQQQQADGTLTRLMAFDRGARMAEQEQALAKAVTSLNAECGTSVNATIAWDTISDDVLRARGVASFCGAPISALRKLCGSDAAKQTLQAQVQRVLCRFGAAPKLEIESGQVTWTTSQDAKNQDSLAARYFEERLGNVALGKTSVCTDGRGHYIVVAPQERQLQQLSYGDGKTFFQVPLPPAGLTGSHFLEPRFVDKSASTEFRGADMRVYSEVILDAKKNTCTLRCGERTVALQILGLDEARRMLGAAKFQPNPQKFVPYALLRDTRGIYYLVERGFQPSEENFFRVYVGPKGGLKQQEMRDVVSDSEGQIFSTRNGELRLVVDRKDPPMWIEKERKFELRIVPVSENLPLIYNELGVYAGAQLGTPCDDQ